MQAAGSSFLFAGGDPFVVVLAGLLVDALLGGASGVACAAALPKSLARRGVAWLEHRLNRARRSARSRAARGAVVAVMFPLLGACVGLLVLDLARSVPEGWLLEVVVVAALIDLRRTYDRTGRIVRALRDDRLDEARAALAPMVPHDVQPLDRHGLARGAAEGCARALCQGGIAPILWYLALGLAGLCAWIAIDSLGWVLGRPVPALDRFGRTAGTLAAVSAAPPSALASALIVLASAFVPGARPGRAARSISAPMGRGASAHEWTLGAMAGALGLALGGPAPYAGATAASPWIGDGRARAGTRDAARARLVSAVAGLFAAVAVALLGLATGDGAAISLILFQ